MNKKNTQLFMAAALIALLTLAGGTLSADPKLFTSPQKEATATQFWSDADLFLSPTGYTAVEFDKFFSAISFWKDFLTNNQGNPVAPTNMLQLGFASQFGSVYTAVYYGGNTLRFPEESYQEVNGKRKYTESTTNSPNSPFTLIRDNYLPYNEASVLIGVADMGIRLSYVHNYRSRKLTDFFINDDHYKNSAVASGSINPEIAWGFAKELIPDRGLQPHLYVGLDFFRDYLEYDVGDGRVIDRSNNEFKLDVTAAMGSFSLVKQNGFDFGVDLWYTLDWRAFNNEYNPKDWDDTTDPANPRWVPRAGTVVKYPGVLQGTGPAAYYRMGYHSHELTPYLCASWSGNRLELSAELGLGLGFNSEKGTQFDMSDGMLVGDKLEKQGLDFDAFTFAFFPTLDLGLKWAIVPEKFFLNVGSHIELFTVSVKTSTDKTYIADQQDGDTEKNIDKAFGGANTRLLLGFTFNPTANIGLQAMSGVDINTNNINLFNATSATPTVPAVGLAVFSKIMVTLKF